MLACHWITDIDVELLCHQDNGYADQSKRRIEQHPLTFAVVSTFSVLMPNLSALAFCLSASEISAGALASVAGASAGTAAAAVSAGAGAAADHTIGLRACISSMTSVCIELQLDMTLLEVSQLCMSAE